MNEMLMPNMFLLEKNLYSIVNQILTEVIVSALLCNIVNNGLYMHNVSTVYNSAVFNNCYEQLKLNNLHVLRASGKLIVNRHS